MSASKVPQLRFKGFNGELEEKKFGNCVLIQRGGSPRPIENYVTYSQDGINWIKIGDVSKGSRYITRTKQKIIQEGEQYSRKVYKGDLILSNSMSFGRPYIMGIDGCIHDGWLLIRDEKKNFSLEYLLQLLSSDYMINQYKSLAAGGVVINLNSNLVQSTKVFIPIKNEQTKIGNYFQKLDKLIEQKQKKHQKLKQLKKAMLAKMFPIDGATLPEVRFKGFSGEWEEKIINDLGNIVTGLTPNTQDKLNYGGNCLFVSPADIQKNRYIETTITTLTTKGHNLGRVLHENSILFVSIGSTIGKVAQIKNKATTNQQINAINPNKYNDSNFIYSLLVNKAQEIKKLASAQAVPIINKTSFSEIEVIIPNYKVEQTKIGNYFQKLDKLIDLQLQELEKLKNIKKASLEKMFV